METGAVRLGIAHGAARSLISSLVHNADKSSNGIRSVRNGVYLVTHESVIANYELPLNWGLLIKTGDSLIVRQKEFFLDSDEGMRLAILQRIAGRNERVGFPKGPSTIDLKQ